MLCPTASHKPQNLFGYVEPATLSEVLCWLCPTCKQFALYNLWFAAHLKRSTDLNDQPTELVDKLSMLFEALFQGLCTNIWYK